MNLDPLPHLDTVVIRVSGIAEVSVAGEPGRETHFLAKILMKIAQIWDAESLILYCQA